MRLINLRQILVLTFFLISIRAYPQSTKFQLHIDFGKSVVRVGNVLNTSDGGYLVCGTLQDNIGTYPFLVKSANYGQIEWKVIYETSTLFSTGKFVIQTGDGGYMMVGETTINTLNKDILVIRTDSLGNQVWNKTYGNNGIDLGNNIVQLPSGTFLIFGESELGTKKGLINRINASGDLLETNYLDIVFAQSTIRGKIVGANQVIVTGTGVTEVFTDTSGLYQGQSNIQLADSANTVDVILDSSGRHITLANMFMNSSTGHQFYLTSTDSVAINNPAWINKYGIPVISIWTTSLLQLPTGGYVISGGITPFFGMGILFLLEVDTTGNILWMKGYAPYNGPDFRAGGAVLTSDGGYVLTGSGYVGPGNYDLYIIKTDSLGNSDCFEGVYSYGWVAGNYTTAIQLSGTTGSLQNAGTPGSITDTSFGSLNVLCYTSYGNVIPLKSIAVLNPNPFVSQLNFKTDEKLIGPFELVIYDMMGTMKINLFSDNAEWSGAELEMLQRGLYIAEVKIKGVTRNRTKLIH